MSKKLLRKISSLFSNHNFKDLDISAIERIIRYRFKDRNLLYTAFKHSSYLPITKEKAYQSNERLEFLGDAVLDIVVTEFLYLNLPKTQEGELSKMKSVLVSRNVLAKVVSNLNLGQHLLINRGEEKTGGRTRTSQASIPSTNKQATEECEVCGKLVAVILATKIDSGQLLCPDCLNELRGYSL